MIEHGASAKGEHIARIGHLILVVEQTPVSNFDIGDKIGWANDSQTWLGTIVTSEPDKNPVLVNDWHLAWRIDEGNHIFHWRGRSTTRDTRWYPNPMFVIAELP